MAELAFAAIIILKEVYLLSRFIARTAKSAIERATLQDDLEFEHLYVRSFGLLFFQSKGTLTPYESLSQEWLEKIVWILDSLRLAQGDYSRLAAERDDLYGKISPFQMNGSGNGVQERGSLISFGDFDRQVNELEVHKQVEKPITHQTVVSLTSVSPRARILLSTDWRSALSEKRQLEKMLKISQEWTKKLKELLQLTMAVNPQFHTSDIAKISSLIKSDDAKLLGLVDHAKLRQNVEATLSDVMDLEMVHVELELIDEHTRLTPAILHGNSESHNILVEMKYLAPHDEHNVLRLAQILALSSGTNMSTIPLRGFIRLLKEYAYAFIFDFPCGAIDTPLRTLYDLIRRPQALGQGFSLEERFEVALSISKSLTALHADGWVHKNFRSRSIVFFHDCEGFMKDNPYLVNFEYTRSTNNDSSHINDDDDEDKHVYRHPLRQRAPQQSFNQVHDLYALGVVLLEIGLWEIIPKVQERFRYNSTSNHERDPYLLSDYYISTANNDLPHRMGRAYTEAVVTCLTGNFGSKETDPSFALAVYNAVIQKLHPKWLLEVEMS
ncbi:hypothetical protein N0V90_010085 [Kalmusia sp. IMI 367209]|nr:hypothetical protein N0V90_010085 [Kalmusia sp. IMI 367209]